MMYMTDHPNMKLCTMMYEHEQCHDWCSKEKGGLKDLYIRCKLESLLPGLVSDLFSLISRGICG